MPLAHTPHRSHSQAPPVASLRSAMRVPVAASFPARSARRNVPHSQHQVVSAALRHIAALRASLRAAARLRQPPASRSLRGRGGGVRAGPAGWRSLRSSPFTPLAVNLADKVQPAGRFAWGHFRAMRPLGLSATFAESACGRTVEAASRRLVGTSENGPLSFSLRSPRSAPPWRGSAPSPVLGARGHRALQTNTTFPPARRPSAAPTLTPTPNTPANALQGRVIP